MENIIECRNLTHYYGNRKIYEDLSFSVPKGKIMGLLGKNGTGKTTSINILSGYLKPKSGECFIFGQNIQEMPPAERRRIGLLIEGHVQYDFMNIEQIERFYSAFYPGWKREAYYELMSRLKVAPKQRISRMSCGQRSQVALGLILAQDPEVLVLDDFSLGLDPGYRRLFVDYLKEYATSDEKTIFLTSHIIQDMERLIDDCIIMDYGKILTQQPVEQLLANFRRVTCTLPEKYVAEENAIFHHPSMIGNSFEACTFASEQMVLDHFRKEQVPYEEFRYEAMNLEDAFIGLTGKY